MNGINERKKKIIITLRLTGLSYADIGDILHLSRQRIEQIASPPGDTIRALVERSGGKCEECGIIVGKSGHSHHKSSKEETYEDVNELAYLCASCHRRSHKLPADVTVGFCHHCHVPLLKTDMIGSFCSIQCRSAHRWDEYVCYGCGQRFKRRKSHQRRNTAKGNKHTFCSRACFASHIKLECATRKENKDPYARWFVGFARVEPIPSSPNDYLRITEAARMLHTSQALLLRLGKQKRIHLKNIGHSHLFLKEEIRRLKDIRDRGIDF